MASVCAGDIQPVFAALGRWPGLRSSRALVIGIGDSHYVEPFAYATDARTVRHQLLGLIRAQPRTAIKTAEDRYLHATFSTRLGFTDDVYFLFRSSEQKIDIKSTSRVGYYDMGVNRRRVERLRALLDERLAGQ